MLKQVNRRVLAALIFAICLTPAVPLNASITPNPAVRKRLRLEPNTTAVDLQRQLDKLRQNMLSRSVSTNLQQAVEQSLANNPNLAESYSQIQQKQWTLIEVRREWYPKLKATSAGNNIYSYQGTTTNKVGSNVTSFKPNTQFRDSLNTNPSIQLSWSFFDPSRAPSINAASESLRAQQLLFDVAARDLVLQTQLAYFELQEQQQLIKNYEQILNSVTKQVDETESLFHAGYKSISDVEQIRTQQFENLSLLIDTYRKLVSAAAILAQAMALPVGSLVTPQDNLALIGKWSLAEAETLQLAEQFREEIQASLAKASSSSWLATANFNRYWPSLSTLANGSFSNTYIAEGDSGSNLTKNSKTAIWNGGVGFGFNWSIFDGGINAAQAQVNQAQAKQFTEQAAQQRLSVAKEVESAYADYQASELALVSTKQQLQSAQIAAIAVRERFNVGLENTTSVVQTYNQSIRAASAFAKSIREFNSSLARLYRYSASWPDGALPLLQKRMQNLK
jgi:outer membrane protein TolC